jgi:hypothetical protein
VSDDSEKVLMTWCKMAMAKGLRVAMGACFGSLPVAGIVAVGPDAACECLTIELRKKGDDLFACARIPTNDELRTLASLLPA